MINGEWLKVSYEELTFDDDILTPLERGAGWEALPQSLSEVAVQSFLYRDYDFERAESHHISLFSAAWSPVFCRPCWLSHGESMFDDSPLKRPLLENARRTSSSQQLPVGTQISPATGKSTRTRGSANAKVAEVRIGAHFYARIGVPAASGKSI